MGDALVFLLLMAYLAALFGWRGCSSEQALDTLRGSWDE
jgi:hypothetical protein